MRLLPGFSPEKRTSNFERFRIVSCTVPSTRPTPAATMLGYYVVRCTLFVELLLHNDKGQSNQ